MPLNLIWLEQASHPVVLEAGDAAAEPALRSFDLAGSLGHGHAREKWWADKLVVPPLGLQTNSSSCSQSSVGFHQESDRASPGRIAVPSLAAEMRAGERWPGKLPLLRCRRKEKYGGYVLGPLEEDRLGWEVRSFVYPHLVEHGLPPTAEQTSAGLGIEPEQARAAYGDRWRAIRSGGRSLSR